LCQFYVAEFAMMGTIFLTTTPNTRYNPLTA